MKQEFDKLLDECIDRMNRGESLEDCLAGYPDHADRLRPLLEAAFGIRQACAPIPRPAAKAAAKLRLRAALNEHRGRLPWLKRALVPLPALNRPRALAAVSMVLVVALVGATVYASLAGGQAVTPPTGIYEGSGELTTFSSEDELAAYLQESDLLYTSTSFWGPFSVTRFFSGASILGEGGDLMPAPTANPERVSETNVQVIGIDEPDIVKTDGTSIFFSPSEYWLYEDVVWSSAEEIWPPVMNYSGTYIIGAFPPTNLSVAAEIDERGDLLLYGDTLMIFDYDAIYGYDVSDPQTPTSRWHIDIADDTYTVAARLYQGKVYLVTQTYLDTYDPCPIRPLAVEGVTVEIGCMDIYCPVVPVPADATYNAMVIDAATGSIESSLSFVGSAYTSVVYMSGQAIYITYSYVEGIAPAVFDFCTNYCDGILPASLIESIANVEGYDISDMAKLTEVEVIIGDYMDSLSEGERILVESELLNRLEDYYDVHKRELERTGIVAIDLDSFAISATGSVPGSVLNQFSLDEHDGYLRIATTVGEGFGTFMGMWWFDSNSANDVYVLDGALNVVGAVQDLGLTERIYAVRFLGDKGYVVTFRQTDPFYVLDLSNPQMPELKGELKIPGYSSYLHPITDDMILGIGEEGWKVKLSLFDVQSPENPVEVDKYSMAEYWSDVMSTHHAFLLDEKHQIFFLPAGNGGYVFSYADNQLELVKAVSDIMARRAVYIDDYLYIIGDDSMVVYDEVSWEQVSELDY